MDYNNGNGGFNNMNGQQQFGTGMETGMNGQGYNNMQPNPTFTKDLILTILQLLCCCQITGIISLIFVIMANSAWKIGNMVEYESKTKNAKTARIVGWILGAVCGIGYLALMVFGSLAGLTE